jgi:hypothetical protein
MRSVFTDPEARYAAEQAEQRLSEAEWQSLPLSVRVACDLFGVLMLLEDLAADIETAEGEPLRWMDKDLDRATSTIASLLQRLAV